MEDTKNGLTVNIEQRPRLIQCVKDLKENPDLISEWDAEDRTFIQSLISPPASEAGDSPRASFSLGSGKFSDSGDYVHVQKPVKEKSASNDFIASVPIEVLKRGFGESQIVNSEIRFENARVRVFTEQRKSSGVRTILTALKNTIKSLYTKNLAVETEILHTSSGVLESGSMTIVMGAPGCGKTTLLKALSGRVKPACFSGDVKLNGESLYTKSRLLPAKSMAYVASDHQHLFNLTVRETFTFATINSDMRPNEVKTRVDDMIQILGLTQCADTIIGDDLHRGVSGGQKRRVTLGEMLMHDTYFGYCLDEVSTGLDSTTTFAICQSFRQVAQELKRSFVISLLQPSPQVFGLFDKVILLSKGYITYQGPVHLVTKYFSDIGYACPKGLDLAEFVQTVCASRGEEYIRGQVKHLTADEFSMRFRNSTLFQGIVETLQKPSEIKYQKFEKRRQVKFTKTFLEYFVVVVSREMNLVLRDKQFSRARVAQCALMGFIVGFLFKNIPILSFSTRFGYMFNAVMFLGLGSIAQLPNFMDCRDVFVKQNRAGFFPSPVYVAALVVSSLPLAIIETFIYGSIGYVFAGMSGEISRYFVFIGTLILCNVAMTSFVRNIGCIANDIASATPLAACMVILLTLNSGFMILPDSIPWYWIWVYYLSPLAWSMRAIALNEFLSEPFQVAPNASDSAFDTIGEQFLNEFQFNFPWYHVYLANIFNFFFIFVIGTLSAYLLKVSSYESGNKAQNLPDDLGLVVDIQQLSRQKEVEFNKGHRTVSTVGSSLPFLPVTLAFRDLEYSVKTKAGPLRLLDKITGYAKPGTMTALMGSSGAGKTTLMDVLAMRKTDGIVLGDIRVNGSAQKKKSWNRIVGYCEQQDIHIGTATVHEALRFSAALRLPSSVDEGTRSDFVKSIIDLLELDDIQDRYVGQPDAADALSSEQKKRLTIAVELVANPSVLFLDEPTSGLDAKAADIVMRVVRRICGTGRTVICTIHQPSTQLFEMFDRLILLKRGGQLCYHGDTKNLVEYFNEFKEVPNFSPGSNPADWILDIVSGQDEKGNNLIDAPAKYKASRLSSDAWDVVKPHMQLSPRKSPRKKNKKKRAIPKSKSVQNQSLLDADYGEILHSESEPSDQEFTVPSGYDVEERGSLDYPGAFTQAWELLKRAQYNMWRTPAYALSRHMIIMTVGVIFGTAYFQLQPTENASEAVMQNVLGSLFATSSFLAVICFALIVPYWFNDRVVYYREQMSAIYGAWPLFAASGYSELPYLALAAFAFALPLYSMIGFDPDIYKFLFFYMVYFSFFTTMTFFGQALSVLLPDSKVATLVGSAVISFWNLFSGFLVPQDRIPLAFQFLYAISPVRYLVESTMLNQFYCDPEIDDCPMMDSISLGGRVLVSDYVTTHFSFRPDNELMNMVWMLVLMMFFRIISLIGIYKVRHISR